MSEIKMKLSNKKKERAVKSELFNNETKLKIYSGDFFYFFYFFIKCMQSKTMTLASNLAIHIVRKNLSLICFYLSI